MQFKQQVPGLNVLNALRHQRFGHPPLLNQAGHDCFHAVLNALRHQRFGHVVEVANHRALGDVLNALRHQRFGHVLSIRCLSSGFVLNALRHQRFGHVDNEWLGTFYTRAQRLTASEVWTQALATCSTALMSLCSTPYGIRGLDTRVNPISLLIRCFVLNALRHQRFGHRRLAGFGTQDFARCSTPYGIRGLDTFAP